MKKLFSIFLLVLISSSVQAEWVYATSSQDKSVDVYIDTGTIKRKNNFVTVWSKEEFKSVQRDSIFQIFSGYKSVRRYEEWDCSERTVRTISYEQFSQNNLDGKLIKSEGVLISMPENIPPDTLGSRLLKIICKK